MFSEKERKPPKIIPLINYCIFVWNLKIVLSVTTSKSFCSKFQDLNDCRCNRDAMMSHVKKHSKIIYKVFELNFLFCTRAVSIGFAPYCGLQINQSLHCQK